MKIAKRIALAVVILLFALAYLSAFTSKAPAAEAKQWKNWGAAPYAASHEEGCKKAPLAIDGFKRMPKEVKEHFKKILGTTCKGGKKDWLTPDMLLEEMWYGPDAKHKQAYVMDKASVAELPVLKSPEGRAYRKGAVAQTAAALSWEFAYKGRTYVLYDPFECDNWSWTTAPVPLVASPPEKKCVELSFNAPVRYVRWGIGTITGPLPPDECNAQRQDGMPWTAWFGECDICIPAIGYIRGILGGSALIPHKYLYLVTHTRQTLRFSTDIWANLVYICLEDAAGKQSCGVYMRPQDWKGRYHVEIPNAMWVWGNCPG